MRGRVKQFSRPPLIVPSIYSRPESEFLLLLPLLRLPSFANEDEEDDDASRTAR